MGKSWSFAYGLMLSAELIGDRKTRLFLRLIRCDPTATKEHKRMRFSTTLLAGLLMTGILAIAPDTSLAPGGGGGGGPSDGRSVGFHEGFAGRGFGHGFHGRHYGYYAPFVYGPYDSGLDDYNNNAYPYYDNDDSNDVQPAPQESTALTMTVQKVLSQLGYYNGPIDGNTGPETQNAIRWFQSVDNLPVTGQID